MNWRNSLGDLLISFGENLKFHAQDSFDRWLRQQRELAWIEGWDKRAEIQGPACPDDHNPYV